MTYNEYEKALSKPRLDRYRASCNQDENKALILYRYNIELCQKFYGVLSIFEVVLRNAIDEHYKICLSDCDWLQTQSQSGFLEDYQKQIFKERDKLVNSNTYSHDKLVASLSLGAWTYMFSQTCYKNAGKTLLQIFPNKTRGLNQKEIYNDLDKIRLFRNRIAHQEPLCFNRSGEIYMDYVQRIYDLITKYVEFMGYSSNELFYGVETPVATITKIKVIEK
ncbi:hypothetical protein SAMD00024442_16_31 [Candidatus Symbiothrix dinenymphae]|nr:hypothetical protein SAMD00024442_16_31 [Candidatus Symbiothrix dinenymphae]